MWWMMRRAPTWGAQVHDVVDHVASTEAASSGNYVVDDAAGTDTASIDTNRYTMWLDDAVSSEALVHPTILSAASSRWIRHRSSSPLTHSASQGPAVIARHVIGHRLTKGTRVWRLMMWSVQGLADIARHVIGCRLTKVALRVGNAWMTWRV